jgi:ABC-type oligopeptide transport system ATPase subunit
MSKSKKTITNDVKLWYNILPEGMKPRYHNPNYKHHLINIPFRMLVVGSSGAGKSTLVLEMIHRMNDTFGNIILCCMNSSEPLYKFLRSKIKPEQLQIYEGYDKIVPLDSLDKDLQHLIIFDDLVLARKQDKIEEYDDDHEIRSAISNATSNAESSDYVNHLYEELKSALEEYKKDKDFVFAFCTCISQIIRYLHLKV